MTEGQPITPVPGQPAQQPGQQDPGQPERHAPDRNLALELARVTEAAAMAAARWAGRGDKNGADGAAVNAMRHLINSVSMSGVVVIGEGEKDRAQTHSLVMRARSGTIRKIESEHQRWKLRAYSMVNFDSAG